MTKWITVVRFIAVSCVLCALPAPAVAASTPASPSEINPASVTNLVDRAAPETGPAAPLAAEGQNALLGTADGSQIAVPRDPSLGLALTTPSQDRIGIGLPFRDTASDGIDAGTGTIAYDNSNGSITVPVVKQSGAVAVNVILESAEAPERYDFPLDLPQGSLMSIGEDGGIVVSTAAGDIIGSFAAPWAKDAAGQAVATHFEIVGDAVVQVVEHQSATVAYPVVADPFWTPKLIESVRRVSGSHNGFTYQVKPTFKGRIMPTALTNSAWSQAVKKGVPNRRGLYEQFYCHPYVVVARSKSTWNLDTWRPTVGLWATIKKKCNP